MYGTSGHAASTLTPFKISGFDEVGDPLRGGYAGDNIYEAFNELVAFLLRDYKDTLKKTKTNHYRILMLLGPQHHLVGPGEHRRQ